jgi:large subunit ribosomal protein L32
MNEPFGPRGPSSTRTTGRVAPVDLNSRSTRTTTGSGWWARWRRRSSWPAAAASSRSRGRWTPRSTCGTCRSRTKRRATSAKSRTTMSRRVLRGRAIDLAAAAAGAVLPGAADEAAVPGGLPRLCPKCGVNLNVETCGASRWGGSPAGAAESADYRPKTTMPNPKRRHSKTRGGKRRTHDALTAATAGKCPQCGEPKAPHRRVRLLRLLQGRQVRPVDERGVRRLAPAADTPCA